MSASKTHWEVKHWSNGIRLIALFATAKQADKYATGLPKNAWVGLPRIVQITSSRSELNEFRLIRKAFRDSAKGASDAR